MSASAMNFGHQKRSSLSLAHLFYIIGDGHCGDTLHSRKAVLRISATPLVKLRPIWRWHFPEHVVMMSLSHCLAVQQSFLLDVLVHTCKWAGNEQKKICLPNVFFQSSVHPVHFFLCTCIFFASVLFTAQQPSKFSYRLVHNVVQNCTILRRPLRLHSKLKQWYCQCKKFAGKGCNRLAQGKGNWRSLEEVFALHWT